MKVVNNIESKGTKFTVVQGRKNVRADDFGYEYNVVFATQPNGLKTWQLSADLYTNGLDVSLEKLQGLLKKNYLMGAAYSFMIDNTGFLMIQSGRLRHRPNRPDVRERDEPLHEEYQGKLRFLEVRRVS